MTEEKESLTYRLRKRAESSRHFLVTSRGASLLDEAADRIDMLESVALQYQGLLSKVESDLDKINYKLDGLLKHDN